MKSSRYKIPTSARKTPNPTKLKVNNNMNSRDPVQVYCRIKPMEFDNDVSCMKVISDTTIIITPPESSTNFRNNNQKEIQTTFTKVFTENVKQREVFQVVALPLVENLMQGKNGLLFTYGVTGSGKTYTMTGDPNDIGIMPRCLDVIFNSISHYQAKKFVFKPDRLNGFDVQSDSDAIIDRQNEMMVFMTPRNGKTPKQRKVDSDSDSNSNPVFREVNESHTISVDSDYVFGVFVTYVEIYNNSVYDLLEDDDRNKALQNKIVREDGNKNMYVHGVTEVEVKSADEAFEVFHRGQRKRRVAHTALNAESSRSHSVFTIRLVQAPLDSEGESVLQDKRVICVSQLSLVDLAGSERTNRTKNTGQRLREAGNINNSLMTLRSCLEILRENQFQGTNKIVPYRDSKLTHLFKNYFEGEGQVRMIVCVNPRADDYDETIQVMKFAEMSQEVQVARPTVTKMDIGLTPGRRQANKIFKEARRRLEVQGQTAAADLDIDIGLVYSLGGPFPDLEISNPHNDQLITNLMAFLEQRINKRNILRADLEEKQNEFRKMIVNMEQENLNLQIENQSLKAAETQQRKKVSALENHIHKTEAQIDSLLRKLNSANDQIRSLQGQLKDKDMVLNQKLIDKQREKQKYARRIAVETDKKNHELEMKLKAAHDRMQNQMKAQEEKLKLVKHILEDEKGVIPVLQDDDEKKEQKEIASQAAKTPAKTDFRSRRDNLTVANPRYRRSQSADRWVDHRPEALVPVGTVLQPLMRRRRSITKLTSPKEITEGASRYCLTAQNHDSEGELETKLYKADILPTSGGGAQVVFNDVECLKQISPTGQRKRSCPMTQENIEPNANVVPVPDLHLKRVRK